MQNLLEPAYHPVNQPYTGSSQTMIIKVPVTTEVLDKNEDLCPSGKAEDNQIIIEFSSHLL